MGAKKFSYSESIKVYTPLADGCINLAHHLYPTNRRKGIVGFKKVLIHVVIRHE